MEELGLRISISCVFLMLFSGCGGNDSEEHAGSAKRVSNKKMFTVESITTQQLSQLLQSGGDALFLSQLERSTSYYFHKNGRLRSAVTNHSDFHKATTHSYNYSESGQDKLTFEINSTSFFDSGMPRYEHLTQWEWDSNLERIESAYERISSYEANGFKSDHELWGEFSYENNRLVQTDHSQTGGSSSFARYYHYPDGKIKDVVHYHENGELNFGSTIYYDEYGRISYSISGGFNEDNISRISQYFYYKGDNKDLIFFIESEPEIDYVNGHLSFVRITLIEYESVADCGNDSYISPQGVFSSVPFCYEDNLFPSSNSLAF